MTNDNERVGDEERIRALIEKRVQAVYERDAMGATSNHAPGIVLFDAVAPLRYVGSETARARTEEWFSLYDGPIGYEVRDLHISVSDDVAFSHFLYRVNGTMKGGEEVNMWVRATLCLRRIDGVWMITHEHDSVPFDGETGSVSFDLTP